jgi:hypothetical protein
MAGVAQTLPGLKILAFADFCTIVKLPYTPVLFQAFQLFDGWLGKFLR